MKYFTHELRGTFGYIRKQTVVEIIKTVILFLMAFGLFFIGYFTLHTKKSLWSVLAVLALLPASKSCVGMIMFLRFRSLKADVYERFEECRGRFELLYENVITTQERSYFLPAMICVQNNLCGYCENSKDNNKKLTEHLCDVLKKAGQSEISVKIFATEKEMLERVKHMNENLANDKACANQAVYQTIKAVSL